MCIRDSPNADPFFRLDRLVYPVGVTAPEHHAPGELVDDDDLAFLDHVVDLVREELLGLDRDINVVDQVRVDVVVHIVHAQYPVSYTHLTLPTIYSV